MIIADHTSAFVVKTLHIPEDGLEGLRVQCTAVSRAAPSDPSSGSCPYFGSRQSWHAVAD
eukprot:CAMPEP_0206317214 /NCGR_PEP_ID=MMETSP0106_2-20121207/16516_1 /ASSEMBLY_ACC=CAM_ASM_000206 /TAXON_ID=81532 /ORGANISM="Acanthoeca-like sp., Strain 10tr" /LENGTH=59 /DNA_ID=CAMNT_0053748791 /DNA_START=39 /DNA_END=216 /DNA_ORIENTATION=+